MREYKKYAEIKRELALNKNRPFDNLFEEGFYESLNLVGEIVNQFYGQFSEAPKSPQSPTRDL
jgi:hypothetical protein